MRRRAVSAAAAQCCHSAGNSSGVRPTGPQLCFVEPVDPVLSADRGGQRPAGPHLPRELQRARLRLRRGDEAHHDVAHGHPGQSVTAPQSCGERSCSWVSSRWFAVAVSGPGAGGRDRAGEQQRRAREELGAIEGELGKTEDAIERYLLAFETGGLPEGQCGQRVRSLAEKAAGLRGRQAELAAHIEDEPTAPAGAELDVLRGRIAWTVESGDIGAKKQLLHHLVHDIQAAGRRHIQPTFRIPLGTGPPIGAKVRKPTGSVPPAGFEPALLPPEGSALSPELRGPGTLADAIRAAARRRGRDPGGRTDSLSPWRTGWAGCWWWRTTRSSAR